MTWVVRGEEAGIIDYYFDNLSKRHKAVIGDPLYRFKSEAEAETIAMNVYYDGEDMYPYEVTDDEQ